MHGRPAQGVLRRMSANEVRRQVARAAHSAAAVVASDGSEAQYRERQDSAARSDGGVMIAGAGAAEVRQA